MNSSICKLKPFRNHGIMYLRGKFLIINFLFFITICSPMQSNVTVSDLDKKVNDLLAKMTLDEKIGQLTLYASTKDQTGSHLKPEYIDEIKKGFVGSIFSAYGADFTRELQEIAVNETRLGIPLLFGYDVIHGHRTIFPIPLAEASSWDLDAIRKSAEVAAREASAEGVHWVFAPMVDIARDPRWGRVIEGAGEDPFLGSKIAEQRVRGFQGTSLNDLNTVAACIKHYAAYGAALAGRDYNSVDMSERMLREVYLPPYKAGIDAGAATIMTSFNDVNGIPVTANPFLLDTILRKEWGFEGFVVTDYTAIMELTHHGIAKDAKEASTLALNAGVDMSMQDGYYQQTLAELVKEGKVSEKQIDKAASRILKTKFLLGLFDDPYRYSNSEREKKEILKPENVQAAFDMAKKSIVLLKNENQILPLHSTIKKIAVIGPLADSNRDMLGTWIAAGDRDKAVSLLEGLKKKFPTVEFIHEKGAEINDLDSSRFEKAIQIAKSAELVIMGIGEAFWMTGEASSRSDINLPGCQEELVKAVHSTGKPIVAVLMNGRPLALEWLNNHVDAILETWYLGTTAGDAIAEVISGDYNPSAKLPITFPRNVGQIPIYYSVKNTGRPFNPSDRFTTKYLDVSNEPLYVFGYGLSYTTFDYSKPVVSKTEFFKNDSLTVSLEIKNSGQFDGEEIVQLYIRDLVASVSRPIKELKGFKKVFLKAGESQSVEFKLSIHDFSFYRADMSFGFEPGEFEIFVGRNVSDTQTIKVKLSE